jgi:hypothetical protein
VNPITANHEDHEGHEEHEGSFFQKNQPGPFVFKEQPRPFVIFVRFVPRQARDDLSGVEGRDLRDDIVTRGSRLWISD